MYSYEKRRLLFFNELFLLVFNLVFSLSFSFLSLFSALIYRYQGTEYVDLVYSQSERKVACAPTREYLTLKNCITTFLGNPEKTFGFHVLQLKNNNTLFLHLNIYLVQQFDDNTQIL